MTQNLVTRCCQVVTNSRRMCAIHFSGKLIVSYVYVFISLMRVTPTSVDEFQFQLSTVDSVISQYPDSHIILGGYFNVDLSRNWTYTKVFVDLCYKLHDITTGRILPFKVRASRLKRDPACRDEGLDSPSRSSRSLAPPPQAHVHDSVRPIGAATRIADR